MKQNKSMYFHYTEWVINHPRFAIFMAILIGLSLFNDPWIASVLFVLFSIEIGHRIALIRYRSQINPYKLDVRRKTEIFFLVLDILAVASLLLTVFQSAIPLEDAVLARVFRLVYLLRAVRLFRYIDLQSALYSPTYGMLVSLIVIISFFAEGIALTAILVFFSVEISVRYIVMKNMYFASKKERVTEWFFWWIDLIATLAMLPMFSTLGAGAALRILRLTRLLRPWMVIFKNLVSVIREGQFMQEINLILLVLSVLSIGGGFAASLVIGEYDYTNDGIIDDKDGTMLAHIWFSFRAFTDPGNAVHFPASDAVAFFSVFAVIAGVFIFAFFIGIGASIVSGLMAKLRNDNLNIANHMVMLGWNASSPFVIQQLRVLSNRTFSQLKLVLLNDKEQQPKTFKNEPWVSYRWGDMEESSDLKRVNLSAAKQAIVNVPDHESMSENLAHSFFSLLSIRAENPNIFINYATPGLATPHLSSYHHQLQVGWDKKGFYNKPTVILSQVDIKANLFRQLMHYPDFDQVISRLMIPVRHDESSLQVVDWSGKVYEKNDVYYIESLCGKHKSKLHKFIRALFLRGVILVSFSDKDLNIYTTIQPSASFEIAHLVGIALDANTLQGEVEYTLRHIDDIVKPTLEVYQTTGLKALVNATTLKVVIIGHLKALPLILKRLLASYDKLEVTIVDDLNREEHLDTLVYLRRRISEMQGASERIDIKILRWSFADMDYLREIVKGADRIILSRPAHIKKRPHAIVSSVLSHLFTILDELGEKPYIFPVVDSRDQAEVLQKELNRFDVEHEVHVVVPNEFYGTYVAHTSFGMFMAKSESVYNSQRALRYVINDLLADNNKMDIFDLDALTVTQALPADLSVLYNRLLAEKCLLVGYRLKSSFERTDSVYEAIFKAFPRENNFRCLRQMHLVINPIGSTVLEKTWETRRDDIVELIVIRTA